MQHQRLAQLATAAYQPAQTANLKSATQGYARIGKVTPLNATQQAARFATRCG